MAWPATIRTWVSGEKPPAATLNEAIRDPLKAIGDAWTSYTPTWTATTTNPTIGNGTLSGAYTQAGKRVKGRIVVTFGSGTTVGSGTYSWALPSSFPSLVTNLSVGTCLMRDASGPTLAHRMPYTATTTTLSLISEVGSVVTHATIAWATGDTIAISFEYEAA